LAGSADATKSHGVPGDLHILQIEGARTRQQLVELDARTEGNSPRVSPDGNWLAFGYQEGSPVPVPKIGMVATAGGALQVISQVLLGARGLDWAPSGKALQYGLTRNGASNVWEQPLTGGTPQRVTKFTSGLIFDLAWSRDRKQLVLAKGNRTSDVILISNFK